MEPELFQNAFHLKTIRLSQNNIAYIIPHSKNGMPHVSNCLGYQTICSVGRVLDTTMHLIQWVSDFGEPDASHCSSIMKVLNGLSKLNSYVHNCSLSQLISVFKANGPPQDEVSLFYNRIIQQLSNGTVSIGHLNNMSAWMSNGSCRYINDSLMEYSCFEKTDSTGNMHTSVKCLDLRDNKVGVLCHTIRSL